MGAKGGVLKKQQIEVFHWNFLRRVLRARKSVPKGMIYGELGRKELKFIIWQRMANFWKKRFHSKGRITITR